MGTSDTHLTSASPDAMHSNVLVPTNEASGLAVVSQRGGSIMAHCGNKHRDCFRSGNYGGCACGCPSCREEHDRDATEREQVETQDARLWNAIQVGDIRTIAQTLMPTAAAMIEDAQRREAIRQYLTS